MDKRFDYIFEVHLTGDEIKREIGDIRLFTIVTSEGPSGEPQARLIFRVGGSVFSVSLTQEEYYPTKLAGREITGPGKIFKNTERYLFIASSTNMESIYGAKAEGVQPHGLGYFEEEKAQPEPPSAKKERKREEQSSSLMDQFDTAFALDQEVFSLIETTRVNRKSKKSNKNAPSTAEHSASQEQKSGTLRAPTTKAKQAPSQQFEETIPRSNAETSQPSASNTTTDQTAG